VVDAPYAKPDYRLGIRSVRERVWRGPCYPADVLEKTLARFVSAKDAIYELYRSHQGLDPKILEDSLEYYDQFFKLAADRRGWERELRVTCTR
jgi:hypothetical protein